MKKITKSGSFWAGALAGVVTQMTDTLALMKGKITKDEYAVHTAENVSSAVGMMAGIEYGAMLGSAILPGVGTIVGTFAGGLLGDKVGRYIGHQTGNIIYNKQIVKVRAEHVTVANQMDCNQNEQ